MKRGKIIASCTLNFIPRPLDVLGHSDGKLDVVSDRLLFLGRNNTSVCPVSLAREIRSQKHNSPVGLEANGVGFGILRERL